MNSEEKIIEIRNGDIQIIKYNKPHRKNAMDVEMYIKLTEILNNGANDDEINLTVLTGVGDYYSSGNDLIAAMESQGHDTRKIVKNLIESFIKYPKLLVAIVNGPAIGIAATTLALCDLVFASENSFFYTPFTKLGIVPEGCSTFTFPRLLGERKATEMLLYSHKMSAREALEYGFVNCVFKPEEIQSKVWDKIIEVSKLPKQSVAATKRLLRNCNQKTLLRINENELEELNKIWTSEEFLTNIINFATRKNKL